jgi:hypothetical protein
MMRIKGTSPQYPALNPSSSLKGTEGLDRFFLKKKVVDKEVTDGALLM